MKGVDCSFAHYIRYSIPQPVPYPYIYALTRTDISYRPFKLTKKMPLCCDANLMEFTAASNTFVGSTLGYHVYLKAVVEG